MTTPHFDELYQKLNERQRQAVDTIEGPVLVAAGPGTGKTQILTLRIANILLKTQINPENILALTFTESAAFEMRQRLAAIIGAPAYRVGIYTFHGLANMLIQQYNEEFPLLVGGTAATELDQIQIVENILMSTEFTILKPIGDPTYYVRPLLSAINDLKKEGVTPEQLHQGLAQEEADYTAIPDKIYTSGRFIGKMKGVYKDQEKAMAKNKELSIVYGMYQQALREKHLYDFNDMLLVVIETFKKNPDFLLSLQEKYHYILVDEHQDTNTAQNTIVEYLCNYFDAPNLFVVGDDKQAIYRFQGASLENFLYFKTKYPSSVFISLDQNYRSTPHILNASQTLINQSTNVLTKEPLQATVPYISEPIVIAHFTTPVGEHAFLARDIQEKITSGIKPEDIAILIRNNKDAYPIMDILKQEHIPFFSHTEENVLEDTYVQYLVTLLKLIANPTDEHALFTCLHFPFLQVEPLHLYGYLRNAREQRIPLMEMLQQKGEDKDPEIDKFLHILTSWLVTDQSSFDLCITILNTSGLLSHIMSQPDAPIHLEKIQRVCVKLQELASQEKTYTIKDFLNYLALMDHHSIALPMQLPEQLRKGVQIMTAHKAKGKEFDYVYIAHVHEKGFGNDRGRANSFKIPWQYLLSQLTPESGTENDDERRLFYVALTRAKKKITITYADTDANAQHLLASPFLEELQKHSEMLDTHAFEEKALQSYEQLTKKVHPETPHKQTFQEYLWASLQQKGISATALNNYLTCPWKFVFESILEMPQQTNERMAYGSAMHKTIKWYITQNRKASPENTIKTFTDILHKEFLRPDLEQRCITQASHDLPGFIQEIVSSWGDQLMSEVTIDHVSIGLPVQLKGRLDLLEKSADGWVIHDYKTGRPRSRNALEKDGDEGNYKRQLIFYTLLVEHWNGKRFATRLTSLDFMKPQENGSYKSEVFTITDEEVQLVQQQIRDCIEETKNMSFWDKRCDDPQCTYCKLRDMITIASNT